MKKILTMSLTDIYLDYVNNFLTVDKFAEYYGIEKDTANELINTISVIYLTNFVIQNQ